MNGRVGYRFHPTDEELVLYFLRLKLNGVDFDDDISFIDICQFQPWELPEFAAQGSDDQVWYFFYRREKINRNPSKPRYKRSTRIGHWKPTGEERQVTAKATRNEIGLKRTLVFYKFGEPELRTNWVIHEYELKPCLPHQAEWVICKLKQKQDRKAKTSTRHVAESSHNGTSDFQIHPTEVPVTQFDPRLLLETLFRDEDANLDRFRPQIQIDEAFPVLQPQVEIEEGFSIDDLKLDDEMFESGSDDLMHQFAATEQNPDQIDDSFFMVPDEFMGGSYQRDPDPYNVEQTASNAYTLRNHSSSPQSLSGVYLEEICDMDSDSDNFYIKSSQFGDSNFKNGQSSTKEYRQMRTVQTITETLPPARYEQSGTKKNRINQDKILVMEAAKAESIINGHEKITCVGKASNTVEKKTTPGRYQNQSKLLENTTEPKARRATRHGTELDQPRKSSQESIVVKTEGDKKRVAAKTGLESRTDGMTCSSKHQEASLINQRSIPVSAYIVNVIIGMVLFIVAIRELLILH